jgi:hypothetical protein
VTALGADQRLVVHAGEATRAGFSEAVGYR